MCHDSKAHQTVPMTPIALAMARAGHPPLPATTVPASPTRRRRLWDLDHHAHCPVVGVCIPIAALRRLMGKALGDQTADAYELHINAVSQCRQRSLLSEAMQKHLDQRFQILLRQAAKQKSTEDLAAWWIETSAGHDLPGALWSTLTHPRCTPALAYGVLGQVHMLQHQVGMATRVDLERFELLIDENAVLARELACAQERSMRQAASFARKVDALEAELVRKRALTAQRQTELAHQHERLAALEAAAPHLHERHALTRTVAELRAQVLQLQRELAGPAEQVRRHRPRADAGVHRSMAPTDDAQPIAISADSAEPVRSLAACSVLCVGGRPASVPLYRSVVERIGGRFLHHDGGEEDNPARLDATLAAADLVICQTGCVSHNAYWRVKDHCKRSGKRCVFVETPSRAALERALADAMRTP